MQAWWRGCEPTYRQELKVGHPAEPDIICTLPGVLTSSSGPDPQRVIVTARYDHIGVGSGAIDNWSCANVDRPHCVPGTAAQEAGRESQVRGRILRSKVGGARGEWKAISIQVVHRKLQHSPWLGRYRQADCAHLLQLAHGNLLAAAQPPRQLF